MPNCFTLTKKGEKEPSLLNDIDKELCELLNEPFSTQYYVAAWYDTIGLCLAIGHSWDKMRETFEGSEKLQKVIDYLEENYTTDAWYEVK